MGTDADLAEAIAGALSGLGVTYDPAEIKLERPQRLEHGDWSTNIALVLAKRNGKSPRELAEQLTEALMATPPRHVEAVEIAGPGFVNFRLGAGWLHDALREVVKDGEGG
jgi:arginyl-tRNA synthetase